MSKFSVRIAYFFKKHPKTNHSISQKSQKIGRYYRHNLKGKSTWGGIYIKGGGGIYNLPKIYYIAKYDEFFTQIIIIKKHFFAQKHTTMVIKKIQKNIHH